MQVLDPKLKGDSYRKKIRQWEKIYSEYKRRSQKTIDEEILIGVVQAKIVPDRVREHLLLNCTRFDTLQKMKDEIDRYLVETEGVDSKDMDITFLGKDRKGKKGKGTGKNGGKKGSDQQHAKGGGKSWWKKPQ